MAQLERREEGASSLSPAFYIFLKRAHSVPIDTDKQNWRGGIPFHSWSADLLSLSLEYFKTVCLSFCLFCLVGDNGLGFFRLLLLTSTRKKFGLLILSAQKWGVTLSCWFVARTIFPINPWRNWQIVSLWQTFFLFFLLINNSVKEEEGDEKGFLMLISTLPAL